MSTIPSTPSGPVLRRLKKIFLRSVLVASFLPLFAMLTNVKVGAELRQENRNLAQYPALEWRNFKNASFFTQLESYFNDHFGFREWLILKRHEFDATAFRRVRPDLVRGKDDYIFYKSIVERYLPDLFAKFPREYMVDVFMQLNEKLAQRGIKMVVMIYPNKELIYHEKLPGYWPVESDTGKLPFYQALEEIRGRGVPVLALAPEFFALKEHEKVYTEAEENHCSPPALFYAMNRLLQMLGELADVSVEVPEDFPKVYSRRVVGGMGYRKAQWVNTNYDTPPPWNAIEPDGKGGLRYSYNGTSGVLPPMTIYTDSFSQTLVDQFGMAFLPYFQELCVDYTTFSPESITPRTKFVVISFSDQSVEAHVHHFKKMLDKLP
jgi:hypothetical protein